MMNKDSLTMRKALVKGPLILTLVIGACGVADSPKDEIKNTLFKCHKSVFNMEKKFEVQFLSQKI